MVTIQSRTSYKKITGIFVLILLSTPASIIADTTYSFSATELSVPGGGNFTLRIVLDPHNTRSYTARMELSYPAGIISVDSFDFAQGWIPVLQPEYDVIDNSTGVLVKTAGYVRGTDMPVVFGTIDFSVKKRGRGVISINNDTSFVLNEKNKNIFPYEPESVSIDTTSLAFPFYKTEFVLPKIIPRGLVFDEEITRSNYNIDIAYLQMCLTHLGMYSNTIRGVFDDITKGAVARFQELEGLLVTRDIDTETKKALTDTCFISAFPEQLFDINFELDEAVVNNLSDLVARVIFFSFCSVPTPVDLVFTIFNEEGRVVQTDTDVITVETEQIFSKKFFDVPGLSPGKYTLRLHTLYNIDVGDDFEVSFVVEPEGMRFKKAFWSIGILTVTLVLIWSWWISVQKRKGKDEDEDGDVTEKVMRIDD